MEYHEAAAAALVCAIKKNYEAYKAIRAEEIETLQVLATPQKWSELPCGSRAQANREYLIAREKTNEFIRGSEQRRKDIAVLVAEVRDLYAARIGVLQNEKRCWESLFKLYKDWEKAPSSSSATDFASYLDTMFDYLDIFNAKTE
ncbi:MAG: hypothetical protein IJF27_05185 [Oscillospiraceae bacterium]|nr:hypothetical protein [Oscillospiraceae bacterium]